MGVIPDRWIFGDFKFHYMLLKFLSLLQAGIICIVRSHFKKRIKIRHIEALNVVLFYQIAVKLSPNVQFRSMTFVSSLQ